MIIVLDAGHGLNTAGKQTPDGIKEWILNDKVRDKVVKYLVPYNLEFIFTDNDEGNTDESLSSRRKMYLNAKGVVLVVSIHHNAFNGVWNKATGVETYTDRNYTAEDQKLAEAIHRRLVEYTGLKDRGIKRSNLYIINQNQVPAVLTEGGFMDSEIDYPVITSEEGQDAYARAVAEGIVEYLQLEVKTTESETTIINNQPKRVDGTITKIQSTLNARYGFGIAVDGIFGKETKKALIKALQIELNKQYNKGLDVDGVFGPKTKRACVTVKKGAKGNITYILQALLFFYGYDTNGVDGIFGAGTEGAVEQFQANNGLEVDGKAGKNTFEKLCA